MIKKWGSCLTNGKFSRNGLLLWHTFHGFIKRSDEQYRISCFCNGSTIYQIRQGPNCGKIGMGARANYLLLSTTKW